MMMLSPGPASLSSLAKHISRMMILPILLLLVAGCATNTGPRFKFGPHGEKIQFKRFEKNLARDWFHHRARTIYSVCGAEPHDALLSTQQSDVLTTHGKPDYMREDFYAESDEYVTEYVYIQRNKVFQFIQGELVFEGPATDYEKILIQKGRPDQVRCYEDIVLPRSDLFEYNSQVVGNTHEIYRFSNGKLIAQGIN